MQVAQSSPFSLFCLAFDVVFTFFPSELGVLHGLEIRNYTNLTK